MSDRDEYLDRLDEAWLDHERPTDRAAEDLICESCGKAVMDEVRCICDASDDPECRCTMRGDTADASGCPRHGRTPK